MAQQTDTGSEEREDQPAVGDFLFILVRIHQTQRLVDLIQHVAADVFDDGVTQQTQLRDDQREDGSQPVTGRSGISRSRCSRICSVK